MQFLKEKWLSYKESNKFVGFYTKMFLLSYLK